MMVERVQTLLALLAALSGLLLSWFTHRRQGVSENVDNLVKIIQALERENQRLGIQMEQMRKQLNNEMLKRVTLEEKLDIARGVVDRLSRRVEALEAELQKYKQEVVS